MRNKTIKAIALFIMVFAGAPQAKTLAVPNVPQIIAAGAAEDYTNWCWAASSQAVLSYTQNAPGMCNIADWARQQNSWGNDDCCTNGTSAICNQTNAMWGWSGSLENILENWGTEADRKSRSLTLTESQEAIDDDSPVVIRWGWQSGGGHFVVLRGYTDSMLDIMDPWNGPTNMTHANASSDSIRTWTHTLVTKPKKVTFVVDDTGSMGNEIASVRSDLLNQIQNFQTAGTFVKYTLITYKDSVDIVGSTVDHSQISSWVNSLSASGGGDCPEAGYDALDVATVVAPGSDIWWMTDADSHGGFLRMLTTRALMLLAGNTLHSVVMGSCSGMPSSSLMATAAISDSDNSDNYDSSGIDSFASAALLEPDLNAYIAGQELSRGTGGLFFPVGSAAVDEATAIILNEITSSALITRLMLTAGTHTTEVPVDTSISELNIVLNTAVAATSNLTVTGPGGTIVLPSVDDGVTETIAGESKLLKITFPALQSGTYVVDSSSTKDFVLSVSGQSEHAAHLLSDTTGGIGEDLRVALFLPSLTPPTGPAGPGDDGPGGAMLPANLPTPIFPFRMSALNFFIENVDGTGRQVIDLFDDGLNDDESADDGIFGGTISLGAKGSYRIGVTDNDLFQRVSELIVFAEPVSVDAPADAVAAPGDAVDHQFWVTNLSTEDRIFNLTANSSSGWANLAALPAAVSLFAGEETYVTVTVNVPGAAVNGDESTLTLTAVAQDDPAIFDSASVKTTAWTGPLLQTITPTSVSPGDELVLAGSGLGADPGPGNRNSEAYHVSIGGRHVPDTNITKWSDAEIRLRTPNDASRGLVFVVAAGVSSNALSLVVNPPSITEVDIDIRPGSEPNSINLGSNGVVPVAILTTRSFDAANVDPSSLTLAGSVAREKGRSGNFGSLEDVDGDGDFDLVVQFPTADLDLKVEDTHATLEGQRYDGTRIRGADSVKVVP